jgi:aspartate/methionine/tyrosine aminotransferase
MNQLAIELNADLEGSVAGRLLSGFGRRIYFPRGIIAQSAEAKKFAREANATIGMAFHEGKLMTLQAIRDNLPHFTEDEAVAYAPTAGIEQARQLWLEHLLVKNPSLRKEYLTLPVVVPGITAAISYTADLFLDKGQRLITCDPCWDNYALVAEERREAVLRPARFLGGNGLDLEAIHAVIREEAGTGAVRIILNFPNNPAGYAPTAAEAEALCGYLKEAADGGADVLVISDDAYFGLFYEEETSKESIFGRLSSLHENILAVKADGPTKEDYVWGLRAAFVTFGSKGLNTARAGALVGKMMGTIRSSVSCSNTPGQHLLIKSLASEKSAEEKKRYYAILKSRYRAVRRIVEARAGHPALRALPFNSGYFMSFECLGVDAEALRQALLKEHGVGTIAFGSRYLRIAFSAVSEEQIQPVLEAVFKTAEALARRQGSTLP